MYVESNGMEIASYEIIDIRGRKVLSEDNLNSNLFSIQLEKFLPGIYFLKLTDEDGVTRVEKLTNYHSGLSTLFITINIRFFYETIGNNCIS
ncbi:MAG: T9SS type A sorting domain-containing protein [Bacteroidales bacterium]|nr:T9SS type A sorting domain-containing protein [Bacteroidales bacterium]